MPKIRPLKPKDIEKILLSHNFVVKRQTGSHRIYFQPSSGAVTVVPFHSKELPTGTLRSIIKQAKLNVDDFRG